MVNFNSITRRQFNSRHQHHRLSCLYRLACPFTAKLFLIGLPSKLSYTTINLALSGGFFLMSQPIVSVNPLDLLLYIDGSKLVQLGARQQAYCTTECIQCKLNLNINIELGCFQWLTAAALWQLEESATWGCGWSMNWDHSIQVGSAEVNRSAKQAELKHWLMFLLFGLEIRLTCHPESAFNPNSWLPEFTQFATIHLLAGWMNWLIYETEVGYSVCHVTNYPLSLFHHRHSASSRPRLLRQ